MEFRRISYERGYNAYLTLVKHGPMTPGELLKKNADPSLKLASYYEFYRRWKRDGFIAQVEGRRGVSAATRLTMPTYEEHRKARNEAISAALNRTQVVKKKYANAAAWLQALG